MRRSTAEKKQIIFDKLSQEAQSGSVKLLSRIVLSEDISWKTKQIIVLKAISFVEMEQRDAYLSLLPTEWKESCNVFLSSNNNRASISVDDIFGSTSPGATNIWSFCIGEVPGGWNDEV